MFANEGLDYILETTFSGTNYYIGLKGAGTAVVGDTLASHPTWTEVTAYSGSRKLWVTGAVASQSISNALSTATFNINASTTVAGIFLSTVVSGTSGTLIDVEDFSVSNPLENGDVLEVTHQIGNASV